VHEFELLIDYGKLSGIEFVKALQIGIMAAVSIEKLNE
jgi:hypothetical protein